MNDHIPSDIIVINGIPGIVISKIIGSVPFYKIFYIDSIKYCSYNIHGQFLMINRIIYDDEYKRLQNF